MVLVTERLYSQLLILIFWSAHILIFILSVTVLRGAGVEMLMGAISSEKGWSNKGCYHWASVVSGTLQQTFTSFDSTVKMTPLFTTFAFQTGTRSTNLFCEYFSPFPPAGGKMNLTRLQSATPVERMV